MNEKQVEATVRECLRKNYGRDGELSRLGGENLNYLLRIGAAERYVVKVTGEAVGTDVMDMESRSIAHALTAGFRLELPETLKNLYGKQITRIEKRINSFKYLRLMKYIEGKTLDSIPDISRNLLQNVGISPAEYDRAMQAFGHPAARRSHAWNLLEADRHRAVVEQVGDPAQAELMRWGFDAWSSVAPAVRALPRQFIHGDANTENIMIRNGVVCGLVDLGDCGAAPVACELAICLAYLMMNRSDPLAVAGVVTDAYHSVRPLSTSERGVLLPLVCGRLSVTLAIAAQRRAVDPDNANWFRSEPAAWRLLARLCGEEKPRI